MMPTKVRGVIRNEDGGVFLVQGARDGFFMLPGGTHDEGESLRDCLKREILEELGVEAVIGDVLSIREFQRNNGEYVLDIWIDIVNWQDFVGIDISSASHAFEIGEYGFYNEDTVGDKDIRPAIADMKKILKTPRDIQI